MGLLFTSLCAGAVEVRIVFGQSLAPYVDEKTATGVEIDIIRAALKSQGHVLVPSFVPQGRVPVTLQAGAVDAAATLTPDSGVKAAYSEVYIEYEDMVIARKGRFKAAPTMAELQRLRIVAFPNAARYLGPAYAAMAKANPRYGEQADQLTQVRMLFGGQADVIVADRRIYEYQVEQLRASKYAERPFEVDLYSPFDKIPYRVAFRDPSLRDSFNAGLAAIRASGELGRIGSRYAQTGTSR
jgi:polar amino acid transport system substrate-binding protein